MSVLEKNSVLIFKNNQGDTIILCPYTKVENVLGAVASINGITPDSVGNVVIAIPTKVSDLANDKGYLTAVPDEYITEAELTNKKYVTQTDLSVYKSRIETLEAKVADITKYFWLKPEN